MCFTINVNTTRTAIEKRFNADASVLSDFEYRYFYRAFDNPLIPVITQEEPNRVQLMNWGLIPHWAKDVDQALHIRKGTYNARAETLTQKPSFQLPLSKGRCLIIARGFFEWQHIGKDKIPWYISNNDHSLFAFAGLYDTWHNQETDLSEKTFSIITTKANPLMEHIHNSKKRMPVILYDNKEQKWIGQTLNDAYESDMLVAHDEQKLKAYTIGKQFSDPNDETILQKVEYPIDGKLF